MFDQQWMKASPYRSMSARASLSKEKVNYSCVSKDSLSRPDLWAWCARKPTEASSKCHMFADSPWFPRLWSIYCVSFFFVSIPNTWLPAISVQTVHAVYIYIHQSTWVCYKTVGSCEAAMVYLKPSGHYSVFIIMTKLREPVDLYEAKQTSGGNRK